MVDLRQIPEIAQMLSEIENTQGDWDGKCNQTSCYWNMFHPTIANGRYNNDESKICVSESLSELKMNPNTKNCPGYDHYYKSCGIEKGE